MDYFEKQKEEKLEFDVSEVVKQMPFVWGIDYMDEVFKLIDYKELITIAWEWGCGKTTYTVQQAVENAKNGHKVLYLSFEMTRERLIKLNAQKYAGIPFQTKYWEKITYTEHQKKRFNERVKIFTQTKGFVIRGYKAPSLEEYTNILKSASKEFDLIFVDNLGMIWRNDWVNETEMIPKITSASLDVLKENNCSIVLLHHLTKWKEGEKWPRGKNAIRGSWKLLDDSDKILIINKTEINNIFSLVKNRMQGEIWTCELIFNKWEFIRDIF